MRSLKRCGGLTRVRGMTEVERTILLLATSVCATVNGAIQEFTSKIHISSEQHQESTQAGIKRDRSDAVKFIRFLSTEAATGAVL